MFFRKKHLDPIEKAEAFLAEHHLIKKPRANWQILAVAILAVVLILFWLIALPIMIHGADLVKKISAVENEVNQIKALASGNQWRQAAERINGLNRNIAAMRRDLKKLGPVLYWPSIGNTAAAAEKLLASTGSLLNGYGRIFNILGQVESDLKGKSLSVDFNQPEQRKELFKSLEKNRQIFLSVNDSINEARKNLAEAKTDHLWSPLRDKILSFDRLLHQVVESTETILPIVSNLPELAGYGQEKNYLLIFQNNMEIRPTGGFIGSYGIITVKDGEIKNIFTDDVYNLDKYSEGKINELAPAPMLIYNKQKYWYLRDANWSPDWPTSAQKILWFFGEERKNANWPVKRIDGVIAITPEFISNLLLVIGPITISGVKFDSQNFAQTLEIFVEQDYKKRGISEENRKDIIGSLAQFLVANLPNLSADDLADVWLAFKKNVDQKNILVYLVNSEVQKYFSEKSWSGEVKPTDGDYLMIIDSNFAALKTDQVMDKSIDYQVYQDNNGDLIGRVAITYNHRGTYVPGLITNYRDYARVYVPKGSWFIGGRIEYQGKTQNLAVGKDYNVYEDLGKRYAAMFLSVNPGESKTLIFEYRLPEEVKRQYQNGGYKFLVQKQPGTVGHNLKISLNFSQNILAYEAENSPTKFTGQSVEWDTDLSVDREIRLKF